MLTLAHRAMLGAASQPIQRGTFRTLLGAGTSADLGNGIAADGAGNQYITGTSGSPAKGFAAKVDNSGAVIWQRTLTLATNISISQAVVDGSGNVYVAGQGRPSGTINSLYIAKYNASGVLQWQRKMTGASSMQASGLLIDASGDLYCAARHNAASTTMVICKYSAGGVLQFQRAISHASNSIAATGGIAQDGSGNIYLSVTWYTANWACIVKTNASGVIQGQWGIRLSATAATGQGCVLDASGNMYLCGNASRATAPTTVPYVCKFNSAGVVQWLKYLSDSAGLSSFGSLNIDSSGGLYCSIQRLICKFATSDGALVWQREMTGGTGVSANGNAIAGADLHFTGNIAGLATAQDALAAKVPTDGAGIGTYGGVITYAEATYTPASDSPSTTTPTFTDAASSFADAAGDMTDAAGSLTIDNYL